MAAKNEEPHSHTEECNEEEWEDTDDPDELRKIYDDMSQTYDKEVAEGKYYGPKRVSEILPKIISNTDVSILDIGCCTGLVGEELHKVGYRNIDGLDISDECIKVAKSKNVYRTFFNEVLNPEKDSSFKTDSYDVVILVGGGMFIDIKNLKDWLRITKPDGHVVIAIMKMEFEKEKYAVQTTIEDYIKRGLAKEVHREVIEDYAMGKEGIIVYLQPSNQ